MTEQIKKMKCECCGGRINPSTYRCEYCGTQYKREYDGLMRIETYQNPCKVYASEINVPMEEIKAYGEEEVSKMAIRQLSRNLAEAIAPNMEMQTEYDPMYCRQRISARVRIVEPKYMF